MLCPRKSNTTRALCNTISFNLIDDSDGNPFSPILRTHQVSRGPVGQTLKQINLYSAKGTISARLSSFYFLFRPSTQLPASHLKLLLTNWLILRSQIGNCLSGVSKKDVSF